MCISIPLSLTRLFATGTAWGRSLRYLRMIQQANDCRMLAVAVIGVAVQIAHYDKRCIFRKTHLVAAIVEQSSGGFDVVLN